MFEFSNKLPHVTQEICEFQSHSLKTPNPVEKSRKISLKKAEFTWVSPEYHGKVIP